MSAVKQLLDHLLSPNIELYKRIQSLTYKIKNLPLLTLQQFIRELSFILYQKQPHCHTQLIILQLLKSILITGSLPIYLLANVYIFPWIAAVNALHKDRTIHKRAELMFRDAVGPFQEIKADNVESYRELLQFVGEFVVFFGENLKFHPYSKYKINHALSKQLVEGSYSRSLEYFIEKDMHTLQSNLKNYNPQFRQDLKQLTQFLSQTVQLCLTNPAKYQDTSYLLLSLIEMSESHCITAIIYRTCSYLLAEYILTACQFLQSVISLAEIQSIEIINSKCLPLMLSFLLPIDFRNGKILPSVQYEVDRQTLQRLIDYYYIWYDKTKIAGLSTRIYEYSYSMVNSLKRPSKLAYQPELKEFYSKLAKMKNNNEAKRAFIIDQNLEVQNYTVKLLKDAQFCLNNHNRKQVAYQNVLDELTLTEKSSQQMSSFSQSLVRSAHQRQEATPDHFYNQNKLKGPPHKKFGQIDSSISQIRQNRLKQLGNRNSILSRQSEKYSSQNIYYTRDSPKMPHIAGVILTKRQEPLTSVPYYTEKQRFQHSEKYAWQASARTVQAKNSTPQKTPVSSPQQSMFLNSSQYSQKDNNVNKNQISSIYLNQRKRGEQSQSGQFLHFEKNSIAKSENKEKIAQPSKAKSFDSDIQFDDTVKLQNSRSQEILQYGMDKAAKLPPSIKKPQFGFKQADTNDSSIILKDISLSWKASPKKDFGKQKDERIATPQQSSKVIIRKLKDSSPDEMILQKRTQNTKAPARSEQFKSPSKQSEPNNIKSIYLNRQIPDSSHSQIKEMSGQPYAESEHASNQSSKVPSNFGSFFKRNKKQKASSLQSSKSLKRIRIPDRQVQIPDFKKMRDLQNQLGRLRQETENYEKLLAEKSKEKQVLQTKKQQLVGQDPYFLKRENEIIKTMLKKKSKEKNLVSSRTSAQNLARQLKESSIKNYTMNLKEYNPNILKLKLQNIHGYPKATKKNIVANRCLILKNDMVEIGYSLKDTVVTLYFTLKHHCESLDINLVANSIVYSEDIKRQFDKVFVGKQMKFKTNVQGTKDQNIFIHSNIEVRMSFEEKLQKKVEEYKVDLPLTPYNLAVPLQNDSLSSLSQSKQSLTHYITPLYSSCEDLLKKGKIYLQYLFPYGSFDQDSSTFRISYLWKGKKQDIKIKLKQRAFRIAGVGNPIQTGRQLIQNIINMLIASQLSQ